MKVNWKAAALQTVGVILVAAGLFVIHEPLSLVFLGLVLVVVGLFLERVTATANHRNGEEP